MLYSIPIDPMVLIVGFSILSLVLLIVVIICIVKLNKLYRRYDIFMRGKDAETLEDTIMDIMDEMEELQEKDRSSKDAMKQLSRQIKSSFQKFGYVKYNAFKGMGGNLSFVIAMLDNKNSGFILDVVHSREGCYIYLKEVEEGATEVLLGGEEQEALEQALGYVKRPTMDERLAMKEKAANSKKKELKSGSGEQDIEVPSSERKKSERMKELRKRQAERRENVEERVKKYADAYDVEEVEIETDTIENFDALPDDLDGEDNKGDY